MRQGNVAPGNISWDYYCNAFLQADLPSFRPTHSVV